MGSLLSFQFITNFLIFVFSTIFFIFFLCLIPFLLLPCDLPSSHQDGWLVFQGTILVLVVQLVAGFPDPPVVVVAAAAAVDRSIADHLAAEDHLAGVDRLVV